jgi:hypothetical protein
MFQDGSLMPFNNPALLMFLMATLPEYGREWPAGEDRLLVVSVGTGRAAVVHPELMAKVDLLFNAKNLPSVFMNGASVAQDFLCRSLGRCRFGAVIDSKFGARIDRVGVGGSNLFTYLRYDVDLSDDFLKDHGISPRRAQKRMRNLDSVKSMPKLEEFGRQICAAIDFRAHFQGLL